MTRHPADEPSHIAYGLSPDQAALQRAQVLMSQRRWDLALQQLDNALAHNPENGNVHGLRAWCLCLLRREDEADAAGREALRLVPDWTFAYWVMGELRFRRGQTKEAMTFALQGLKLSPHDADLHALVAAIHMIDRQWKKSLAAAETALAADPHDLRAATVRARVLRNLGRRREANEALSLVLSLHPTEASAHANKGWDSLQGGRHDEALEHFQEALRLDPQLDWAREGVLDVLRAQNPLYRVLLALRLWLERRGRVTWGVLFALIYLPMRIYGVVHHVEAGPIFFGLALVIGLTLAVFMPWIAESVFDFALLFKPRARFILNEDETRLAKLTVALFGAGATIASAGAAPGFLRLTCAGLVTAALVLPLTGMYHVRPGTKGRKFMRDLFSLIVASAILGLIVPGKGGSMFLYYAAGGTALSVWLTLVAIRRYGRA